MLLGQDLCPPLHNFVDHNEFISRIEIGRFEALRPDWELLRAKGDLISGVCEVSAVYILECVFYHVPLRLEGLLWRVL